MTFRQVFKLFSLYLLFSHKPIGIKWISNKHFENSSASTTTYYRFIYSFNWKEGILKIVDSFYVVVNYLLVVNSWIIIHVFIHFGYGINFRFNVQCFHSMAFSTQKYFTLDYLFIHSIEMKKITELIYKFVPRSIITAFSLDKCHIIN